MLVGGAFFRAISFEVSAGNPVVPLRLGAMFGELMVVRVLGRIAYHLVPLMVVVVSFHSEGSVMASVLELS